jgi:hypothetical protein
MKIFSTSEETPPLRGGQNKSSRLPYPKQRPSRLPYPLPPLTFLPPMSPGQIGDKLFSMNSMRLSIAIFRTYFLQIIPNLVRLCIFYKFVHVFE